MSRTNLRNRFVEPLESVGWLNREQDPNDKRGYILEEIYLIDQYDEETVLLQIPQDDTRIEDVVKKFKDQNKVIDTIVALKDKRRIIDGQGYMRRLVDAEAVENSDVRRSGVNRWICGEYGKKFHSQEPYRNRNDHAICDECKEKSIS